MAAEKNRAIKKLLEQAFGRGKVRVRGGRGTSHGWVYINIAHAPKNQAVWRELLVKVDQLLAAGKIEIGTYGYDDPGSDYGFGKQRIVTFEPCLEKTERY